MSLAPPHAPIVDGLPVPVVAHPDQLALLNSDIPQLAANKRLVFDMWRMVIVAGHGEAVEQYLTPEFIEHSESPDRT